MHKILFIGDIVGRPGRTIIKDKLPAFKEEHGVTIVVANAENSAGGSGLTKKLAEELFSYGIDVITLGDHVWDQRGFDEDIDSLDYVCRPANLPDNNPGKSFVIIEKEGLRLGIFTVLGRNFMPLKATCPFTTSGALLEELKDQADALLIEVHAETTSEKVALGWFLDGKASLVVGTHTHIPTADARVLPQGTAYMTDAGMTGPYASVLGRKTDAIIERFTTGMPKRFPVAEDDVRLCGCLVTLKDNNFHAESIEPICIMNP
tara:strand:+ start:78558 stop:79343 length:786 start_codon:yes stop_codon:yes gene_type:complete